MLIKEPKEVGKAPAMIVFCAFEQMQQIIEYGKKYGFMKSYPLVFVKNYSGQVLKANMKIVGATEAEVNTYQLFVLEDRLRWVEKKIARREKHDYN